MLWQMSKKYKCELLPQLHGFTSLYSSDFSRVHSNPVSVVGLKHHLHEAEKHNTGSLTITHTWHIAQMPVSFMKPWHHSVAYHRH